MADNLPTLVQQAVRDGIGSASTSIVLLTIAGSCVGAFFAAYLKAKATHLASKEDFNQLLKELKLQTQATERIRGTVEKDLATFGDSLERDRQHASFRRERITQHLDQILGTFAELYALTELVALRQWLESNADLEAERRFKIVHSQLQTNAASLAAFGLLPSEKWATIAEASSSVAACWTALMGEAVKRTPEFTGKHPDLPFSPTSYHNAWMALMSAAEALGREVRSVSYDVVQSTLGDSQPGVTSVQPPGRTAA
jgi:hypothetical protein